MPSNANSTKQQTITEHLNPVSANSQQDEIQQLSILSINQYNILFPEIKEITSMKTIQNQELFFSNNQRNLLPSTCCSYVRRLQTQEVVMIKQHHRILACGCSYCDCVADSTCISACNVPPVITGSFATQSVIAGQSISYSMPAYSDADGDGLTVNYAAPVAWVTLSGDIFIINPSISESAQTFNVQVWVSDQFFESVHQEFSITVTATSPPPPPINQNPSFDSPPLAQTIQEGNSLPITLPSATDPENSTLSLQNIVQPSWVSFDGAFSFTLSPLSGDEGTYSVQFDLYDGTNYVASSFDITVTAPSAVNQNPYFDSPLLAQTVQEGNTLPISLPTATDPESITLSIQNIVKPTWVNFDGGFSFTLSPLIGNAGTYSVQFDLYDGTNYVPSSFGITVTPIPAVNQPPGYTTPPVDQTLVAGNSKTYTLPVTSDPENDSLTITINSNPSWATFDGTNVFTFAPPSGVADTQMIGFNLSDATHNVYFSFNIIVTLTAAVNNPPSFTSSLPNLSIVAGITTSWGMTGTQDPEFDTVTVTLGVAETWITISGTSLIMSPPALTSGTFNTEIILSDGVNSVSNYMNIDVTIDENPYLDDAILTQYVTVGSPFDYILPTATDPEGNTVTYAMVTGYTYITFSQGPPKFTLAPTLNSQQGTRTVSFSISDSFNTVEFSITVIVLPGPNYQPCFTTPLNLAQQVTAGTSLNYIIPPFTDPDLDTVTLSTGTLPAFATFNLATTTITLNPLLNQGGQTFYLDINLSDGITAIFTQTVAVTITRGANAVPNFLTYPPDMVITMGSTLTRTLPGTNDNNGDTVTITSTIAGSALPSFINFNPSTGVYIITPLVGNEGSYTLSVVLSDGYTTNSHQVLLTVNPRPNTAPIFNTLPLPPFSIAEGLSLPYTLPGQSDAELDPITITTTQQGVGTLPIFMSYASGQYQISPSVGQQGSYTIEVIVSDFGLSSIYTFVITVTPNTPPTFVTTPLNPVTLALNSVSTYTLPNTQDAEGNSVAITSCLVGPITLPSFIAFDGLKFTFSPIPGNQQIFNIQVDVSDGFISTLYYFDLTVTNSAPVFQVTPLANIILTAGTSMSPALPLASDAENQLIIYSATFNSGPLPIFLEIQGSTILSNPIQANVGSYTLSLTISDGYLSISQPLTIIVNPEVNLPPTFSSAFQDLTVQIGQSISYTIPSYSDVNLGDALIVSATKLSASGLPSFVSFSDGSFSISPTLASQASTYQIEVTLTDNVNPPVKKTFIIYVPIPPPISSSSTTSASTSSSESTSSSGTSSTTLIPMPADLGPDFVLDDGPPSDNLSLEDLLADFDEESAATVDSTATNNSTTEVNSGGSVSNSVQVGPVKKKAPKKKTKAYIDKKSGLIVRIVLSVPIVPVQAKISKVNMKGLMTIVFSNDMAVPMNYTRFNENFLRFSVISGDELQPGQNKAIRSWQIVDFRQNEMDIQLNFTDPMAISQSLKLDRVQIQFLANGQFLRNKDKEAIKYKYTINSEVPTQLVVTGVIQNMEKAGDVAGDSMNYLLYGNLGLQVFMSVSMQLLWGMVNTLQLIIHMNMLSIIMPANVKLFFSFIVNIVNLKVFDVKKLVNKMFGLEEDFRDNDVSPEFKQTGYESTNLLQNIGMLLFVLMGVSVLIVLILLLRFLQQRFTFVKTIVTIVSRKLFFNSLLRGFLEAYLKFSISTFIAIQALKIDTTQDVMNTWTSVIFLLAIIVFPPFVFFFLRHHKLKLETEDFRGRFESLYLNVDTREDRPILMMSLFIFRRLVYAANIVFFKGSSVTQLFVQFFCCLLMLLFFVDVKPLNQHFLNRIEIFNELTLLICSYFLFAFTDYVPDPQTRYNFGWAFIGIAVFNIMVNWLALFYKVFSAVRMAIRKAFHSYRIKQYLAQKQSIQSANQVSTFQNLEQTQTLGQLKTVQRPLHFLQLQADNNFGDDLQQIKTRLNSDISDKPPLIKKKKFKSKSKNGRKDKQPKPPIVLKVNLPPSLPAQTYKQDQPDLEIQNNFEFETSQTNTVPGYQGVLTNKNGFSKQEQQYIKTQPLYAQKFANILLRKYD